MFSRIFVAAVAVFPFVAAQVSSDCARTYTVQAQDYCDKISAANNASTYQLAAVNFPTVNADCTNLQVGQQICLGTTDQDCKETYAIQSDDTCEKVMQTFSVNGTILAHNNPQINADCTNLYVGEVLCVANEGLVPPAPAGAVSATPVVITASTNAAQSTIEPVITASSALTPAAATPTPVAASPATATPAPTADSGDDDDLPFCDELEDDE
ncbi:carbohydrate-binding module family 50 protein [Sphaerobolus stellatus SS14]|nr:carbohydrate-binding module family 50 protein [Sphaerobolus stellatus SS14]